MKYYKITYDDKVTGYDPGILILCKCENNILTSYNCVHYNTKTPCKYPKCTFEGGHWQMEELSKEEMFLEVL